MTTQPNPALPDLNTLTAGELRALIAPYADHEPVLMAVPSGDYWHTLLARPIAQVTRREVYYREYSRSYALPASDREPGEDDEPTRPVLLLAARGVL